MGRLTFAPSRSGFMLVEPALFAGSLTARDVVAILYLQLCGRQLALPWQLRKVLQEKIALVDYVEVGDPTANILRVAREEGAVLILIGDVPPSIVQRILPAIGLSIATITSQVVQRATVPVVALK